jgi:hypothetical protein
MTSKETTAVASDHGSGEEITVWVGVPGLARGLPSSGSLLIVEAEPQRARELRQVLRDRPEALVCEEVLAAENETKVRWHRFNDTRLNGPSDLTIWQQHFPNLRQIDEEQRCGRRLGDLLDNWDPREGEQALAHLHLVLRQGDPLAALAGLGPWTSQVQTVQLMLPWPEETMQLTEAWLAEHRFVQDAKTAALWNRDPIATRDWLLKEKEKEKQSLIAAERQLHRDYEAVQTDNVLLSAKLEQLSSKFEDLRKAQDLTQADIGKSQAEADKLKSKLESLQQECQQLTREKSELLQKLGESETAVVNITTALKSLFPMQLYRERQLDLCSYDEENLLLHYIQYGQGEGRLKTYEALNYEWESCHKNCEEAENKLEHLEAQFELAQQQLETLKDLFARLANRQESPRQAKEND